MHLWPRAHHAVSIVAAAVLAGCGSATPSPDAISNARMIRSTNPLGAVPAQHLMTAKSWIRADAGKQWLLYVSDASAGTIDIYNYRVKAGKLYGRISGLSFPYGQCVDGAGHVYVVDYNTSKIYEYAHGGTTPIETASDDYGNPIGCSVDPTTGNVAITNFNGPASGAGGIDLFAGGLSGSQANYTDANIFRLWPGGYDVQGNLFVQGTNVSGSNIFAKLPAAKSTFVFLTGLTVGFPGSVQWDGAYLAVTDQNYRFNYTTEIYRVTVSGSKVAIVRATQLTDNCYPGTNWMVAVQPFITGTTRERNAVVAGNLNCPQRVGFWNYTNGGTPKRALPPAIAPGVPYGQSVSPPTSGL